jgi:hypothetical protein
MKSKKRPKKNKKVDDSLQLYIGLDSKFASLAQKAKKNNVHIELPSYFESYKTNNTEMLSRK